MEENKTREINKRAKGRKRDKRELRKMKRNPKVIIHTTKKHKH